MSAIRVARAATGRGSGTPELICVGTRTPPTEPVGSSDTIAVTVRSSVTRTTHVPPAGHWRRTA